MTDKNAVFIDVITEIVNVGVGAAASTLNDMLGNHIQLDVPNVELVVYEDLTGALNISLDQKVSSVLLEFFGFISGSSALIFEPQSAHNLAASLTGEDPDEEGLDEILAGALNEVGNIVLNSILGSIANTLDGRLDFLPPVFLEGTLKQLLKLEKKQENDKSLVVDAHFKVGDRNIDGAVYLILHGETIETLENIIEKMYD
jgi:chemotaxis protein CheC